MNGRAQCSHLQRMVEAAGLVLLLLAPVCFDPRADGAFESAKTTLVWLTVIIMAAGQVAGWLFAAATRLARAIPSAAPPGHAPDNQRTAVYNSLLLLILLYLATQIVATLVSVDVRRSLLGTTDYPRGSITLLCLAAFSVLFGDTLRTEG